MVRIGENGKADRATLYYYLLGPLQPETRTPPRIAYGTISIRIERYEILGRSA